MILKTQFTKLFIALVIVLAFMGGLEYGRWLNNQQLENLKNEIGLFKVHPLNSSFKLINPLLAVSLANQTQFSYEPVKNAVNKVLDEALNIKSADLISVYFRDLERGYWVGINENEDFDAASLLKIPIMIAYLKEAEINPKILSANVYFEHSITTSTQQEAEIALSNIKPGQSYSVETLLKSMIIDSDNVAKKLLIYLINHNQLGLNEKSFEQTYGELGINVDSSKNNTYEILPDYRISPRTYSLFFRILYNATFLNYEMSEKAMEWLSQTAFNDGLTAGLPSNITVAHKFGQYAQSENNIVFSIELHDCGVIYGVKQPYFLCVMTKGNNLNNLKEIIKNISKAVYTTISKQ